MKKIKKLAILFVFCFSLASSVKAQETMLTAFHLPTKANVTHFNDCSFESNQIIFPNPVTNKLIINNLINVDKLEIWDKSGKKVMETNIGSLRIKPTKVSVSKLSSGIYQVILYKKEKRLGCWKFIKK